MAQVLRLGVVVGDALASVVEVLEFEYARDGPRGAAEGTLREEHAGLEMLNGDRDRSREGRVRGRRRQT